MFSSIFYTFLFAIVCIPVVLTGHSIPAHAKEPTDAYIGDIIKYEAAYEDTFVHLARDYNLGFVELRAANPDVDPWVPGRGTQLILPSRHLLPDAPREGIVINLPEMRLYVFGDGPQYPQTFPIGVGREGLDTPVGQTKIVRKQENPVWRPTARMRKEKPELPESIGPGPENPLGTHALYLGWPLYAIHGTNRPFGIGRRISSGCIRLYPERIKDLYKMIPVGTPVTVIDQPLKLQWIDDRLYLEAHPSMTQAIEMEETGQAVQEKMTDQDVERIRKIAGNYEDRLRWSAIRTAVKERRGYPVEILRRPSLNEIETWAGEEMGPHLMIVEDNENNNEKSEEIQEALMFGPPPPPPSYQYRTLNP